MEPVKGLPDLVFTANAGLVLRDKVFLAQISLSGPAGGNAGRRRLVSVGRL